MLWISRYASGGLVLDLEAVEELTAEPAAALDRLIELLPATFRVDWASRVHRVRGVLHATGAAPADLAFVDIERRPVRLDLDGESGDGETLYAGARIDGNEVVVVARRGGPEFLDSEVARLGHLASLAVSIARD